MRMAASFQRLPDDLPVPVDDGACDHLPGMEVPGVALPSTAGGTVRLADQAAPRTVVFAYPRTGRPGEDLPGGEAFWNSIPGARGCTPQACAYRDAAARFRELGVRLYGLSTQDTAYQREMATRLGLPFEVLSDAGLELAGALRLPTFEVAGQTLLKRHTLVINRGVIEHVFYPVFPPDRDASQVLTWLEARTRHTSPGTR
jgi:peroxiredoxin